MRDHVTVPHTHILALRRAQGRATALESTGLPLSTRGQDGGGGGMLHRRRGLRRYSDGGAPGERPFRHAMHCASGPFVCLVGLCLAVPLIRYYYYYRCDSAPINGNIHNSRDHGQARVKSRHATPSPPRIATGHDSRRLPNLGSRIQQCQ